MEPTEAELQEILKRRHELTDRKVSFPPPDMRVDTSSPLVSGLTNLYIYSLFPHFVIQPTAPVPTIRTKH